MKLILIARVSDVEQRKALPAQKLKLKNYAAIRDPEAEYFEFDESAFKDTRKKFAKLVEHIKEQKELVAVVHCRVDRYTRDATQEEVKALNQLVKAGKIELHFPDDGLIITKDSPATDLFRLGIGVALSKYYSDSIRDNVQRRFDQMLQDGLWVGYAPVGYCNVHKGTITKPIKDIEVDPIRAPFIVTIYEKRSTGMSYGAITKLVNAEGMTGKSGKPMTKANVDRILHNPFYYGFMQYNGKQYAHKYPTLITKDLYDKCQQVREQRHNHRTAYKSLPFIFSDVVRCKDCGCSIGSYVSRNNVYLKCTRAKKRVKCTNVNVAEKLVVPQIMEVLDSIRLSDENLALLIKTIQDRHGNQQQYLEKTINETRKEYDSITAQLKALTYERIEAVKNGRGVSAELFDEITEELTNKQQTLNRKLISLTDANKSFLVTISHLLDLGQHCNQLFKQADIVTKNKLLRFIVPANIYLYDKQFLISVSNTYKAFIQLNKKDPEGSNNANWCRIVDALQTSAIEANDDYKLKHLVEIFQLSGTLISD
jgi:DNA invertase Pin-like site-specific DNA recombinase